ncbi:MAG: hypothetical protein ACXVFT_11455 [Solirubrobacteraceae bacterium]
MRPRLGGPDGNEALTKAIAIVLTLLLAAEGITILDLRGLRTPHMFIGLLLIGPVLAKLGSTGYRLARYYTGSRPYRLKGPPELALRLLAPVFIAATITVLATGVGLLIAGHRSGLLMGLHKASFVVWGAAFAVHFLAYLPRVARSLVSDWSAAARRATPGAGMRLALVAAALAAGIAVALAALPAITGWHGGHF